jgi:type IV pilus assembly protein PilF
MGKVIMHVKIIIVSMLMSLSLASCVTVSEKSTLFNPEKKSKSENVNVLVKIAFEYLRNDESEQAIQVLKKAQGLDKKDPIVYEALALSFQKIKENELAEENFLKALKLKPEYSRGRNNYASFLYSQKRYEESCQELETVISDVFYIHRSNSFANLGKCAEKLNDQQRSENAFTRALAIDPNNKISLLELALIKYIKDDLNGAQTHLKRYHQLVKKGQPKSLLLGYNLARSNQQTNEMDIYKKALIRLYPYSDETKIVKSQ